VSEFPGVALAFSVIRTKGNKTGGDKALADNATIWERGVRERVEDDRLRYAAARRSDKRMFGGGRLALKTLVIDCSPRFLAVRGGGTMLYGINATFGTLISIETTSESLDDAPSRPPMRTPARPSSTR
jgi:hypothetical protein